MSRPTPGLFVTQFSGRLSVALAECITAYSDERLARGGSCLGFHDWEEMLQYDRDARAHLMAWTLRMRERIEALHFLVSSKFVHMGVTVGNLTLGMSLQAYTARDRFDAALRHAMVHAVA